MHVKLESTLHVRVLIARSVRIAVCDRGENHCAVLPAAQNVQRAVDALIKGKPKDGLIRVLPRTVEQNSFVRELWLLELIHANLLVPRQPIFQRAANDKDHLGR